MNELVKALNKVSEAWELIVSTEFERSDLSQMVTELQNKLVNYNIRMDKLIVLTEKISMLEEIYQACYQEDSKTIELVENKLIELRKEWRELSKRNNV